MLPHHNVLTRLGVSQISGVGVFAIAPIKAGTELFAADRAELRSIDAAELNGANLSAEARSLYHDFAVRRGARLLCPESFDLLTPGWYLNEPAAGEDANVTAARDCSMTAARDIQSGEELTVRYASFSDR